MEPLEKRVMQLEIDKLGLQFQVAFLLEKLNISGDELAEFAKASLAAFDDSDKKSDMALYLTGVIKGLSQDQDEIN
ncbi:hypothetical protein [Pseudolactococcus paracarnosus]|uniref:Uncharacterized protein n=2 Tax=Pseudolactococcus paracarnosus TaxID=2749962 RepID=A0A7L4WDC9_9LACT|nr:hypothetical protein [Lactococcus paracarnosus]SPC35328.1 hypothetical protein LPICM02_140056 [Lactococcus piscium]MCJ1977560.1 hypothetical protein [Lactococcus paracarnosus]MCJ1983703.1 hypothetical protein [Lactococcus paracarnosus]MCJ1998349.1 hypothetical protein [Lactococcus paracarnosus]QDJ28266.1 hypothetical protein BHS01_06910 [Lactococcus paracarnosus]